MKRKKNRGKKYDEDMPQGKLTVMPNFLPPPDKLVFPLKNVKVTITLSEDSIQFFKNQAKKNHVKYQKMIREVLDLYVRHYGEVA